MSKLSSHVWASIGAFENTRRLIVFAVSVAGLLVTSQTCADDRPLYLDDSKPIEQRIEDLLPRLTLEEKVSLCHGESTFSVAGVPRLGIPQLWMDDGPMGVREEVGQNFKNLEHDDDFATAMPATLGLAATFNTDLAADYGRVIGAEAKQRRKNIMLGPSLNIQRTPLCGRNFEYMGEDPYLTARMAVNYIKGEQSQGVGSCAKHYAANNQEVQRNRVDVDMDERTLREIYLPAFRASVQEADVLSIMGAYNLFRGQHCCENDYLLNQILKNQWGFKGIAMSDWGGVHSTDLAAMNGMDLEMGTHPPYENNFLARPFLEGLQSGKFPTSSVDDKVRRHLYVMFKLNMIHDPQESGTSQTKTNGPLSTKQHQEIARRVAEESIVLLKNEHFLPLDSAAIKSIAVIGANADAKFSRGGGAANIKSPYEITALDGIKNRLGEKVTITYAKGYSPPTGRGRRDRGDVVEAPTSAGNPELTRDAVAAAKSADVVIYVGGLNHNGGYDTEGSDRPDLKLPSGQDELLSKIVEANPKTVVVLMGGGAVEMGSWLSQVPAVLYAWYPGMEGGNALARVIFGDVNTSGKLPCTFPKQLADSPAHHLNAYPGNDLKETYDEGLLVGYRWFDTKQIEPLFPFGHGLSYTTFEYSNLKLTPGHDEKEVVNIEFDLKNTGQREGAEATQIYVHDVASSLPRPEKELKGFTKTSLKPGETKRISTPLGRSAFAFYDPDKKAWVAESGEFKILVGSSSRDIRLTDSFNLPDK